MSQVQPLGYILRLLSYTEAEALVVTPLDERIQRGQLLEIIDQSRDNARYLAVITDVVETEPHPLIDPEEFRNILQSGASQLVDAMEFVRALLDPQSPFRFVTTVVIKLRILGRLMGGQLVEEGRPPRPRSIVRLADSETLRRLLCPFKNSIVSIGALAQRPEIPVCIDLDKLNMHLAVLGQTGSGKTETVKRIVYEAIRVWLQEANGDKAVLVMDIAGEYTGFPYRPERATPLLEALAGRGLTPPTITVIVPYDPSLTNVNALRSTLQLFTNHLSSRGVAGVVTLLLPHGKSYALITSPATHHPWRRISPSKVARVLMDARCVVVAAPWPDTMPVEILQEVAKLEEDREYTAVLLDALEELRVVENIPSITLLTALAELSLDIDRVSYPTRISIGRVCHEVQTRASNTLDDAKAVAKAILEAIVSSIGASTRNIEAVTTRYWRSILGYVTGSMTKTISKLLDALRDMCNRNTRALEVRMLRLSRALYRLTHGVTRQTKRALYRRLSRTSKMVSRVLTPGVAEKLIERIARGFTIIHLAPPSTGGVNHPLVVWTLHRLFRRAVRRYSIGQRYLVVVEEAHNLAPAREETFSKRLLARYAREGRKWGLSLVIVSQRPVGVDPTLLSQAATLIALRVTNPEDQKAIRESLESVAEELVQALPDLEPGEAVVSGVAVPERRIPLLTRIRMVE